jgi:hypothetical protein
MSAGEELGDRTMNAILCDNLHLTKLILAVFTFVAAAISAVYWLKSSRFKIETAYTGELPSISDVPELHIMTAQVDIFKMHKVMNETCRLNKWAAVWTGIAALLGAVTTIVS